MSKTKVPSWGIPYGTFSVFSLRYLLASQSIAEYKSFISSATVEFDAFNADTMLADAYAGYSKSSRQGAPNRIVELILANHSNYTLMVDVFRRSGPQHLRPFAKAICQAACYASLTDKIRNVEITAALERSQAKINKSFETGRLYRNPLFAPEVKPFHFTFPSIRHGVQQGIQAGTALKHLQSDVISLWRGLRGCFRQLGGSREVATEEALTPQITLDVLDEYRILTESLQVQIDVFDEEAVINEVMSMQDQTMRRPGRVLAQIRHLHTNYDSLYFSEQVRSRKLWMATGHRASRRAVYVALLDVVKTDLLRDELRRGIDEVDASMRNHAIQIGRCRNPERLIRDSYIVAINKNIQMEERRQTALAYASPESKPIL